MNYKITHNENMSRTLDNNPKASKQASIDVILQRYKEQVIQGYVKNKKLMQGKLELAPISNQQPIQLMKKWTLAEGIEDIEEVPADIENWLRCKYKEEEIYINITEMADFPEWDYITHYNEGVDEDEIQISGEDASPIIEGEPDKVVSIEIRKQASRDHQYIIIMLKGGENIKIDYGSLGGNFKKDKTVTNTFGVPIQQFNVPEGLTGEIVFNFFEQTKEKMKKEFDGGNCGGLASNFVSIIGGISSVQL